MSGAVMNYDFGPKRHWRRWVWNRITERLVVRPAEAIVLYLAGANDFDRQIALDKGFRAENLIAIERDSATLNQLRRGGALTVGGSFNECVFAAAKGRLIHVVFGDFCNGFDASTAFNVWLWNMHPHLQHAVYAFNLMRGRDPKSNDLRAALSDVAGKHRGKMLFQTILVHLVAHQSRAGLDLVDEEKRLAFCDLIQQQCEPAEGSYKSTSGQVFDSIVWRGILAGTEGPPMFDMDEVRKLHRKHEEQRGADRAFAAVWAHRTMKLQAREV